MRLNTEAQIDGELRKLAELFAPESLETDFVSHVWDRAEADPHPALPMPSPVGALCLGAILGIMGLWIYQTQIFTPAKADPRKASVPLNGVVLDTEGGVPLTQGATLEEGQILTTGTGESVTFFFPGAGYLHLGENSRMVLGVSRKQWPGGDTHYEVRLEEGHLYSRLEELDSGTRFEYLTPHGKARVVGTDFLISVKKEISMGVEVLKGIVEVQAPKSREGPKYIKEGVAALISEDLPSNIFISDLTATSKEKLKQKFEEAFGGTLEEIQNDSSSKHRKFRIVIRKEEERLLNR